MITNESAKISILLPTRGRTSMLYDSIKSLVDNTDVKTDIEILLGFDEDDTDSLKYFHKHTGKLLTDNNIYSKVYLFPKLGYHSMHKYVNTLAKYSVGDWLLFWNDDAVMIDYGYDRLIRSFDKQFVILAFDTHNRHPNSIFPIVPKSWYEHLGYISPHPLIDTWVSQIAWVLDIMVRTDHKVLHDRYDLTGKNLDDTYKSRSAKTLDHFKNDHINNTEDINHPKNAMLREQDMHNIAKYMENNGYDVTAYKELCAGRRDPWAKMEKYDVNKHTTKVHI